MIGLRPYQTDAIAAFRESPLRRKMIVLPTGAGKTFAGLSLARAMNARTLWLAHRSELITQPHRAAQLVWPEASRGIVQADRNEYMRDLVFASIQSAQQERRTAQLAAQKFDLVVIDEAHRSLAPGYIAILNALGCFREDGPQLLGITATPERTDNAALEDVYQGIVFNYGITTAIAQGYLIAPTVVEQKIEVDLDAITTSRGDYGQKELDLALMKSGIVASIVDAHQQHCANRKTIIFTVSVAQAESVAESLRGIGVAAACVSGETPNEERRSILRKFSEGRITTIANCAVLTEGFDEPSVDAVILGRPTKSKPMLLQCVGRGLRLHPGKSDCVVVDMVGVSKLHSLAQAAVIFGLRPEPKEEKETKPRDMFTDSEEFWRARYASQIDGVAGAPRSKLRWLPSLTDAGWILPSGAYGTIHMAPHGELWSLAVVGARAQQLSDVPVTMDIAQAIAEDFVRRVNALRTAEADAPWRTQKASDKQIAMLKRQGVKADQLTRGTAADIITQKKAQKAIEPASSKQIAALRRSGVSVSDGISKREAAQMFAKMRGVSR